MFLWYTKNVVECLKNGELYEKDFVAVCNVLLARYTCEC